MVVVYEIQHWAWDPTRETYAPGILVRDSHELDDDTAPDMIGAFFAAADEQALQWLGWARDHFESAPDHLVEMVELVLDPMGAAPPGVRKSLYLTPGGHVT